MRTLAKDSPETERQRAELVEAGHQRDPLSANAGSCLRGDEAEVELVACRLIGRIYETSAAKKGHLHRERRSADGMWKRFLQCTMRNVLQARADSMNFCSFPICFASSDARGIKRFKGSDLSIRFSPVVRFLVAQTV